MTLEANLENPRQKHGRTEVASRHLHKKTKTQYAIRFEVIFLETCLSPVLKMMAIWQNVLERLMVQELRGWLSAMLHH